MIRCLYFLPFILIYTLNCGRAELYSALVDLERALDAERGLAEDLDIYVRAEERRLKTVRQFADKLRHHSKQVSVQCFYSFSCAYTVGTNVDLYLGTCKKVGT